MLSLIVNIFSNIAGFIFVLFIIALITSPIWLIVLECLEEDYPWVLSHFKEKTKGEILPGDKKRVKNGTAVYMTYETFMTLHEANPNAYPLILSDDIFVCMRDNHSVVFKTKEAKKIRKEIRRRQEEIDNVRKREWDAKEHDKLMKEREKAQADVERMLKDIRKFSDEKDKELSKALTESAKIAAEAAKNMNQGQAGT